MITNSLQTQNLVFLLLMFISALNYTSAQENDLSVIDISEARSITDGITVKVKGVVTVPSGYFASSIPYGFAIQDETAGIYIVDTSEMRKGQFQLGDKVEVTGIRSESYGLSTIKEYQTKKVGVAQKVTPALVKTGDINESTEGTLISTSGVIKKMKNDTPYGYKVYIDDGSGIIDIFVNTSTGMLKDSSNWQIGKAITVTGFSSQYGTEYECDPRVPTDIIVKKD